MLQNTACPKIILGWFSMRPLPGLASSFCSKAKLQGAKLGTMLFACGYTGVFKLEPGINKRDSAIV